MIFIAHRGNIYGPTEEENKPEYVQEALKAGFHAEVDVWLSDDDEYWLGHDVPQYKVPFQFLVDNRIWCHAKDIDTFMDLAQHSQIQAFYQNDDLISLTTNGYFWCHQAAPKYGPRSIITFLGIAGSYTNTYAICSDYCFPSQVSLNPPKLILIDVDGVMTDGSKSYNDLGSAVSKSFYDKDFTAIKKFQAAGVKVGFISSDLRNQHIARQRGVGWQHNVVGGEIVDKKFMLSDICYKYGVNPQEIAYVGDDYYDLALLESVGFAYCPKDAVPEVQARAFVLDELGGYGVIVKLWEELKQYYPHVYPKDSLAVNP